MPKGLVGALINPLALVLEGALLLVCGTGAGGGGDVGGLVLGPTGTSPNYSGPPGSAGEVLQGCVLGFTLRSWPTLSLFL